MDKLGNSHELVTHWTPMHLLGGIIMAKRGWSPSEAFLASITFELIENTAGVKAGWVSPEGANNMTMDTVFNMLGYYLGKKL